MEEEPNSTLPESVRAIQREGRPGGRRRRLDQDDGSGAPAETAESIDPALATGSSSEFEPASELAPDETSTAPPYEPSPEPTAPPTGGRRHRAEGAPTWQDVVGREKLDDIADSSNGRRVSPLPASSGTASSEEPSADEPGTEQESPAGSHTEGLSVSELLAAHGSSGSSPRRRRRAED